MPSEAFMRLNSYGQELYRASKGIEPVTVEKMMEIDSLITICRESAKTGEEKSIVIQVQEFWDTCLRKWYSQPDESVKESAESAEQSEDATKVKSPKPGPIEKAKIFIALITAVRTLKSRNGLIKMTQAEFTQTAELLERCSSIADTNDEKKLIENSFDIYRIKYGEWKEQHKMAAGQEERTQERVIADTDEMPPEAKFDNDTNNYNDRKLLISLGVLKREWGEKE